MTEFCMVRHGETDWNRDGRIQGFEDIPLNTVGEQQADLTGIYLAQETWDVMICSPYQRTRTTADGIGRHVQVRHRDEVPAVGERNGGVASGLTMRERQTQFPDGIVPGMESQMALQRRAITALTAIAERYPGQRIIVVSHGGFIHALLSRVSKGAVETPPIRIENASISRLVYDHGHWDIRSINEVAHLATMDTASPPPR